jgi:hypothetical protein
MALNYTHPDGELDDDRLLVPHELLRYLNNKRNVGDLVPDAHLARRRVVRVPDLQWRGRPVVVKAATDDPSAGGHGVAVCHGPDAMDHARELFAGEKAVIAEEFVEIRRNMCVQFVALHTGRIEHLGIADQISDPAGRYQGSRLVPEECPPAVEVGTAIVKAAAAMGYIGVAGFDMALDESGRLVVFDLNFRFNASTVPLLLAHSTGASTLRFKRWVAPAAQARRFLGVLRDAVAEGVVVPLAIFDPVPSDGAFVRMSGIVPGADVADVDSRESKLSAQLTAP